MNALEMTDYLRDEYIDDLEKKGRKNVTVSCYRNVITEMCRYLDDNGRTCDPRKISDDDIRFIIDTFPTTENTIHHYVKILGAFMEFNGNGIVKKMNILWNDNGHPNVRWITRDNFNEMLSECETPNERMVLLLGAYCGLRRSEIAQLTIFDYTNRKLVIRGKGHGHGKVRILPLSDTMVCELDKYLEHRTAVLDGKECDALIVKDVKGDKRSITVHDVSRIVPEIGRRADIKVTPHSLRRLFATMLSDKTHLEVIQTLMGHTSIETTARYIHRDVNKMALAMASIC